jgi:hypothetical protein
MSQEMVGIVMQSGDDERKYIAAHRNLLIRCGNSV